MPQVPMGVDVLSAKELEEIAGGGEPTDIQMRLIYGLDHPVGGPQRSCTNSADPCKSNHKWNPSCFGGLGWKMQKVTSKGDKAQDFHPTVTRGDSVPFGGLQNLGATCYMNSILQCLYANKPFRRTILALEHEVVLEESTNDRRPLEELRRLFANLAHSQAKSYDPAPFVTSLQLSTTVCSPQNNHNGQRRLTNLRFS
jgi:hypothetical protein